MINEPEWLTGVLVQAGLLRSTGFLASNFVGVNVAAWAWVRVELIGADVAKACQTPKPSQASPTGVLQIAPGIELRTSRIR